MISKAFVFDFDDTLAETKARVFVKVNGCIVKALTSAEFAGYTLADGESFDFSDFENPEHIQNAQERQLAQFARAVVNEGHKAFVLTARKSKVGQAIKIKLNMEIEVICVGDKGLAISEYKKEVLSRIAGEYTEVRFYDDDEKNLAAAKDIGIKVKQATH